MIPIPLAIRKKLAADPFMEKCIYEGCPNKPEWEHAIYHAGRRLQEPWAIVPCCTFHHRGPGLNKRYNQYIALKRATDEDFAKYPRFDWKKLREYLTSLFEEKQTHIS